MSYLLLVLILLLRLLNGYYLSLNSFQRENARTFCIEHCNSDLASIHNLSQHQELVELINNTLNHISFNMTIYTKPNIYIGYKYVTTNTPQWTWSDGSAISNTWQWNNNSNLVQWAIGHPNWSEKGHCVALNKYDYSWISVDCDEGQNDEDGNYIFACNHCNGRLTKYEILDDFPMERDIQSNRCKNIFDTALASIHSNIDMNEASLLITTAKTQNNGFGLDFDAYIGLWGFQWDDGTSFDYGQIAGIYPWDTDEPTNNLQDFCVLMNKERWKDFGCNSMYALCNAPSEICYFEDWVLIIGDVGDWNIKPCQVDIGSNDETIAIINGKRWDNDDQLFVIEYMYKINNIYDTNGCDAGIILDIDKLCGYYYYIGISSNSNVFIKVIRNGNNQEYNKNFNFNYQFGTFYLLRVEVKHGKYFRISVNNVTYIDDIEGEYVVSGYIGIKTIDCRVTVKSLFVSGTIKYELNKDWFDNGCYEELSTLQPTINPTITPTIDGELGVEVEISFNYNVKNGSNTSTEDVKLYVTTITNELITEEINDNDCADLNDNDVNVTIDDNDNKASIDAIINVCNEQTQNELTVQLEEDSNDLQKDLIDKVNNDQDTNIDIIEGTTDIKVNKIGGGDIVDIKNDKKEDNMMLLYVLIGVGVLICCVVMLCVIAIIQWRKLKRRNAEKLTSMQLKEENGNDLGLHKDTGYDKGIISNRSTFVVESDSDDDEEHNHDGNTIKDPLEINQVQLNNKRDYKTPRPPPRRNNKNDNKNKEIEMQNVDNSHQLLNDDDIITMTDTSIKTFSHISNDEEM